MQLSECVFERVRERDRERRRRVKGRVFVLEILIVSDWIS